ncbi:protein-L-histidine N-pros-methyltransferase [Dermatophagoides farinae]|uniref:Methyltransferase-like protein 9-like protein n=1 Tax=Dermatophagoides farinae TaxID=6954 RepID=A0A9D4P5H1_DERFA|nr:protein-L-histidine N-pros-methyltransferase-like [Dermatophagoides farinae]KAH7645146.1 methyltransferase-like protein 9-like protein [Dermatophagoides farinae]
MPLFRRSVHLYLLKRHCREATLFGLDKSRWYRLVDDNDQMLSDELRGKFIECHLDLGTQRFIDACYYQSKCLFRSLWILIMRSILKLFISSTSICGLLNCGRMFVFSDEQIEKFCFDTLDMQSEMVDNGGRSRRQNRGTLLDIGAGDGNVTAKLAKYFNRTYVTELSRTMQNRLIKRAFHLLDVDEWHEHEFRFDMISCLNVLDRCDRPLDMLSNIRQSLQRSGGHLLLAIVLPLVQYVESKRSHQPEQYLPVQGQTFEQQVQSFWDNVLAPAGFELICWTKLPYLSEGNIDLTYFWLIDAIFLLKPAPHNPSEWV